MKSVVFVFLSLLPFFSNSQALQFTQTGFDSAYCRLFPYQNGGGVVYADATGGSPGYDFLWTNQATGATTTNSTWGGLNPGYYDIKIYDMAGDSIMQTIFLDSISPLASFNVVSSGLTLVGPKYNGNAPVSVDYVNNSTGLVNPLDPFADTTCLWEMTQFQTVYIVNSLATQSYTYNYGGDWYVQLEVLNANGCSSVMTKHLDLNGPAGLESKEVLDLKVFYNSQTALLNVIVPQNHAAHSIDVFDVQGKKLSSNQLSVGINEIHIPNYKGVLLYSCKDVNGFQLKTEKVLVK